MTNSSVSPIDVVSAVEEYLATLPATRRGRRTHAEIYGPEDDTPETENYATVATKPAITIELDDVAQAVLPVLLGQLGEARSVATARLITAKIYQVLGLEVDGGK